MHETRLRDEIRVEIELTGITAPRLDAEERHAARLRPDSKLTKTFPGQFEPGSLGADEPDRSAGRLVENDGVVIEQTFGEWKTTPLDRRGLRPFAQQAAGQAADRGRLG